MVLYDLVWFQSLIGIIWNCNLNLILAQIYEIPLVSIPNRDYLELQFLALLQHGEIPFVFQSLIGIIWNCNPMQASYYAMRYVSIPNRDYLELQC